MSVTSNKQLTTILGVGLSVGLGLLIAARLSRKNDKSSAKKESTNILGLEMGGTGCKISLINKRWNKTTGKYDYQIVSRHETESTSPTETVDRLLAFIQGSEFSQIGIASFGPVCLNKNDPAYGSITSTPKLQWQHFSLLKYIREKTSCQDISIDTDVNAAALAEYKLGNHNANSLIYVTVGTGVGVGVVVDGKPVHGLTHPEGGHIFVRLAQADQDFEGVCPFHKNCLEGMVTNVSIAKRLGKTVHELPSVQEDHEVWGTIAYYLAQLCLNLTLIASPEVIVIGGGIMNQPTILGNVHTKFTELLNNYVDHPRLKDVKNYIKLPTLGNNAGLLGGAVLCEHDN